MNYSQRVNPPHEVRRNPDDEIPQITLAVSACRPKVVEVVTSALVGLVVRGTTRAMATTDPGMEGEGFGAIAGSPGTGISQRLADAFGLVHGRALPIYSPSPVIGMLTAWRPTWARVSIPGERSDDATVRVDARLAAPSWFILLSDLIDHPGDSPLVVLSRFLHPRDRLRFRLVGDGPLPAVATFAIRPVVIIVIAPAPDGEVRVAVTSDLLAAELVAVALGTRGRDHEDAWDRPGPAQPWEDPAVQRLTAAGLGVDHPSRLTLVEVIQAGADHVPGALSRPSGWVTELGIRLGIDAGDIVTATD